MSAKLFAIELVHFTISCSNSTWATRPFIIWLNYSCLGCSVSRRKTKPSRIWPCHSFISYSILQLIFRPALYLLIYLRSLYFWWGRPPILSPLILAGKIFNLCNLARSPQIFFRVDLIIKNLLNFYKTLLNSLSLFWKMLQSRPSVSFRKCFPPLNESNKNYLLKHILHGKYGSKNFHNDGFKLFYYYSENTFFKALSKNLFFKYCHKNKHAPHRFSTWKFNNSRLPLSTIKTKLRNDQSAKCQWFRGLSAPSSCLEARSPCSHFNFYVPEMKKSVQI